MSATHDPSPDPILPVDYSSPARVRFGRKPYQLIDQPVAEQILCQLSETMPALFGRLLAEALIGPEAVAKRARTPR